MFVEDLVLSPVSTLVADFLGVPFSSEQNAISGEGICIPLPIQCVRVFLAARFELSARDNSGEYPAVLSPGILDSLVFASYCWQSWLRVPYQRFDFLTDGIQTWKHVAKDWQATVEKTRGITG